jgi:predicted dehydrogenase
MRESGGGSIINISGGGATSPRENFSSYATSKAAIVRFSETLAMETRGDGIRVNCIAPGAMKTSMLEEVIKKGNKVAGEKEYEIARKIIVEGGASMERVAELALFLASDESNGITGKLISAVWDNWKQWPEHLKELNESDVYTIRRIAGRDRGHLGRQLKLDNPLGIGIIGCGLIGQKRAMSLSPGGRLVACADIDSLRARSLAKNQEIKVFQDWRELIKLPEVDAVVIATLHNTLAEITIGSIEAGKHVLVEKPAACSIDELQPIMDLVKNKNIKVHVGFNHRYHRAIRKAKEIVESGALSDIMFIRARYGHGGRLGYNREWRANPMLSGGGELIDQGSHLIDLARWFLGDFSEVNGFAYTYFWDMPVEDNGFLLLKTFKKQVAFLHASCTEWKNLFSMEIYGRNGKLEISGLGGSYGVERLTHYKMTPEMGPPETIIWEYPMGDDSWAVELAEFYEDIHLDRLPSSGLVDAYESLKIIKQVYKESGYDNLS